MVEQDTIKLLRECDAGVKMGIESIDDILDKVEDREFKRLLIVCKDEHSKLQNEIEELLNEYHDEGKEPQLIAKGMSWMKTNVHLAVDKSDQTISDLMTDGCTQQEIIREVFISASMCSGSCIVMYFICT